MIGLWIDAQDDEVLGRLAAVPEDKWQFAAASLDSDGMGCLLAHGSPTGDWRYFDLPYDPATGISAIERQFDNLAYRFGDARIGRLISERARRVLEERRKVETFVRVSLPTLGEALRPEIVAAYVEAHLPTNREPAMEVGA